MGKEGKNALIYLDLMYGLPEGTLIVHTPSGGMHLYYEVETPVKGSLDFMKKEIGTGIDIKCKGGYVLGPGSELAIGKYDCVNINADILPAPEFLINQHETYEVETNIHQPGEFSPEQLEEMLAHLDPVEFSFHDDWFEIMCASHHATGGHGKREFIAWSTSDPRYRNHIENICKRWDSLKFNENSITSGTLIHHVREAGGEIPWVEFQDISESPAGTDKSASKRFLKLQDLKDLPLLKWLVQGILTVGAILVLVGKPGTFKTFLSLHIALCITYGLKFFGRKVEQGDVIYMAGESPYGFRLRVEAWEKFHNMNMEASPFFMQIGGNPLNLEKEIERLIKDIQEQDIHPKLIVIDTLQIYLNGNENSAEDMGSFVQAIHKLRDQTGASIIIVHHVGKDESRGPRGHTALIGAADAIFEMHKKEDHTIVQCKKMKEASDEVKFALKAQKVLLEVPKGQDGEFSDSLVLIETDVPLKPETELIQTLAIKFNGKLMKDFKSTVAEKLTCSESTAERKIKETIGTGEDQAVSVGKGRLWLEPHPSNSRGPLTIRYQEWDNWESNEDFI